MQSVFQICTTSEAQDWHSGCVCLIGKCAAVRGLC